MKPHTKEVLEAASDVLVSLGLKRKLRGKCIWRVTDEIWGGIVLSQRDWPDGSLNLSIYGHVYWDPVDKIMNVGWEKKHNAIGIVPTYARYLSPSPALDFGADGVDENELGRLRIHVQSIVIPAVLEMSTVESILADTKEGMESGGGKPEKYLAIKSWLDGINAAEQDVNWMIELVSHQVLSDGIEKWFGNVKSAYNEGILTPK